MNPSSGLFLFYWHLYVKYILPLCLDNIFKVTVQKTVQGLGLSVTGGVVSATPAPSGCFSPSSAALEACSWPGLIRIKKIFPHGAAWQTNKLAAGDVLLSANGQPLTGCTNYVRSFPAVECVFCCCCYAFGVISHFIMPPEPFTNISTKYSST